MQLSEAIEPRARALPLAMAPCWLPGWLLAAALLIFASGPATVRHEFMDPDNALRLVQVRDLVAGQAWFDPVQYRLNPPEGTPMHWARWVDGALALQIGALTPVMGARSAETLVSFAWPLGLLAILMMTVSRIGRRLGEDHGQGAAVAFAAPMVLALSFPAVEKFGPGFLDHHNIMMCLLALASLAILRLERGILWGVVGGCALGSAIGTAAEVLPLAATALVISGLRWIFDPDRCGRAFAALGAAFAATSALMFAGQVAPSDWGAPVCDMVSRSYVAAGFAAGCVAVGLYLVGRRMPKLGRAGRTGVAMAGGGVAAAGLVILFPECAGGGYGGMSETLQTLWLPQVSEARSLATVAGDDLGMFLASAGAPLAVLVLFAFSRKTMASWVVTGLLFAAVCVLAWQVRGATFGTLLSAPLAGLAIVVMRDRWRRGGPVAGFAAALLVATPAAWAAAGEWTENAVSPRSVAVLSAMKHEAKACSSAQALARLNSAPTGVILNEFSLGAAILQHTGHSVLAAPYHRNERGLIATIETFRASADTPPSALPAHVDYVLVCPGLPESSFYARHAAEGVAADETLAARLSRDDVPDWLTPVDTGGGPLRLYRVVR